LNHLALSGKKPGRVNFDVEVSADSAERKRGLWERRFVILRMMCSTDGDLPHGGQRLLACGLETKLAEYFGVHRSTICCDKEALLAEWRKDHICPVCGAANDIPLKTRARLARRGIDVGCSALGCNLKNSARASVGLQ